VGYGHFCVEKKHRVARMRGKSLGGLLAGDWRWHLQLPLWGTKHLTWALGPAKRV